MGWRSTFCETARTELANEETSQISEGSEDSDNWAMHTSKGQTQHPSASKKPTGNIYFVFFVVLWLQPAARMPNIRREKGEKRLRFDVDRGAGGSQSFMPTRTAA